MKIIVEALNTPNIWQFGSAPELRIYANQNFFTDNGQLVTRGLVGTNEPHLKIQCSLTGNTVLYIPSFEIDSTPLDRSAFYTAIFVSRGRKTPYLSNFAIPSEPAGTTWAAIRVFQMIGNMRFVNPPMAEIQMLVVSMIANAIGNLRFGSETQVGSVALDFDPLDPNFPIAVSATNPDVAGLGTRLPSEDENAALQGTAGSPSNINRYVTDEDSRIDPATPSTLGISELTVGAPDPALPKVVSDNDTRLVNPRVPTGPAGGGLTGSYPSPTLAPTGVTPGTYRAPIVGVNSAGQITSIQNGLAFPQPAVADPDGTLAGVNSTVTTLIDRLEAIGVLTAPALPIAPTDLVATPVSISRIDLSWISNSTDETGFKIERKTPGGAFAQIDTVGPGVTTYQNIGLSTDTTYVYRVRAFNGSGNSAYTNEVNASTNAPAFSPVLYHSFFQPDSLTTIPNADTGQSPIVLDGTIGTKQYAAYVTTAARHGRAFECGSADGTISFQIINPGVTQGLLVRADVTRYILIRIWNSNYDVTNQPVVGSGTTLASGPLLSNVAAGDWFSIDMNGADFTLLKNGVSQATFNTSINQTSTQHGVSLDGPGASVKHLIFTTEHFGASSIQIVKPAAYKVFQRNGGGNADIAITGSYVGSPTSLEARFNGGPWKTISDNPTGGVFSSTLTAQATGQGWLEVRFGNSHGVISRIPYIGVGDVYVVAGQSNAEGRVSTAQFYSHATLRAGVHDHGNDIGGSGRWREAYDPTDSSELASPPYYNSAWPLLATLLLAHTGYPIGFITTAHGQTGFFGDGATWTPPNGNTYQEMINAVRRAEASGVKAILWYQGESDARGETNEAGYIAALESLRSSAQADLGLTNLKLVVAQLANLAVSGFTRATLDPIRQAQVNASAIHSNILVGPVLYDLDTCTGGAADCIHVSTPAHAAIMAARWAHMLKFHFYSGTEGRGPVFLSATRVDPTHIDVAFTVSVSPLLPASADTKAGWRVINSDTQAVLTITSAIRQTPTSVRLTMASPLPTNVKVSWASFNDAVGVALTDSSVDLMPAEPFINQTVP